MGSLLWTLCVVLFAFWILGFATHVGGSLIHLLLVVAGVILVYNLITKGRASL